MSYVPKYKEKADHRDDSKEDTRDLQPSHRQYYKEQPAHASRQDKYAKNEDIITHYFKIPDMPEVKRTKPNEQQFNNKLKDISDKAEALKIERKEQKNIYKEQTKSQTTRIDQLKANILLGGDCIKVLQRDLTRLEDDAEYAQLQINRLEARINKISRKTFRQERKPIEKWTTYDFDEEIKQLEKKLSKEQLDKRGSDEIISQINKLQRQKVTAPQGKEPTNDDNSAFIEKQKENLHSEKELRNKALISKLDTQFKISAIVAQLESIEKEKAALEKELEELKQSPEFKKSKDCKAKILELREQKNKITLKYNTAIRDFEEEQKLIEYIRWATEVQKRKKDEHEYEKQQRRKDKMRDQQFKERKDKDGKEKGGKDKDGKQIKDGPQEQRVRPPPPHPFAQELENLRFLVSYCQRLKPTSEEIRAEQKKQIDVESAIKAGDWANMKGISVIANKKKDLDDEIVPKKDKKQNKSKVVKELLPSSQLEHSIEVVRYFDNFKVIPPQKLEDIDNVIRDIDEKIEYYKTANPDIKRTQPVSVQSKPYRKKEDEARPKKLVISSADFPSL